MVRCVLQARLRVPQCPVLWRTAVRTELRAGNDAAAEAALVRGLQDCKDVKGSGGVGSLWAMYIALAPRAQRKGRMADCVRQTDDAADVFAAFGAQFAADRKFDHARRYFRRSTALDPDLGDVWGRWIAAETADGKPEGAAEVLAAAHKVRCRAAAVAAPRRDCDAHPRMERVYGRGCERTAAMHCVADGSVCVGATRGGCVLLLVRMRLCSCRVGAHTCYRIVRPSWQMCRRSA